MTAEFDRISAHDDFGLQQKVLHRISTALYERMDEGNILRRSSHDDHRQVRIEPGKILGAELLPPVELEALTYVVKFSR